MDEAILKQCKETLRKNNFQAIKKLGTGGFGVVYLVQKIGTSELYAIKCTYKKQFGKKPAMRRYLKQEISIMETLHSPNIVRLYRTFQDDGWIFMLMEYCDQGNISAIQSFKPNGVYALSEALEVVNDVIEGLIYMHNRNILHRDIKPENILRKKQKNRLTTKICDLGFSREAKEEVSTFCGTTFYMAPEIFAKEEYDQTVDIWALGVLLYSMLFATVPFKSINMLHEIEQKCQNGFDITKRKLKQNPSVSKETMQVLSQIFKEVFRMKPKDRMSLKTLQSSLEELSFSEKKKSDSRKTLDTDGSSDDASSPRTLSFEMQQVLFVKSVLEDVRKQNFLNNQEFRVLRYFLQKVSLSILSCERKLDNKKEFQFCDKIWNTHKKDGEELLKIMKNLKISKLPEIFSGKPTIIFREYKEEYRLAVGHAFFKAHKSLKDTEKKTRLKLKIFCCHVINRIFQKEYLHDVFRHYFIWVMERYPSAKGKFAMKLFEEWLQKEEVKNIANSVQLINNKFYRKNDK